jgi:hypothetical protein
MLWIRTESEALAFRFGRAVARVRVEGGRRPTRRKWSTTHVSRCKNKIGTNFSCTMLMVIRLFLSKRKCTFSLGEGQNDFVVPSKYVSKQHCKLSYRDGKIQLHAEKQSCWVETDAGKWQEVKPGNIWRLSPGRSFRLLRASHEPKFHQAPGIQFSVLPKNHLPNQMDHQYLELPPQCN